MSETVFVGGTGRPKTAESDRRRGEFLRLLSTGESFADAAEQARIAPKRVLALLDGEEFWQVAKALREARAVVPKVPVAEAA